jgi:peptidoglycan/LPS O-acetylase OafA/YrhL
MSVSPSLERVPAHVHETAPEPRRPSPVRRVDALTSLRFFAALYVVLFHVHHDVRIAGGPGGLGELARRLLDRGYVAVSFFFVLSGFILAHSYAQRAPLRARPFYVARFARIYPVYALGLLLAAPIFLMRVRHSGDYALGSLELVLGLTLTQAFVPSLWYAVNIPGWSLSAESFFYVLFPRLFDRLASLVRTPARAAMTLAACWLAALLPWLVVEYVVGVPLGARDASLLANFVRYCPLFSVFEFAFGVTLGLAYGRDFLPLAWVRRLLPLWIGLIIALLSIEDVPHMALHDGLLAPIFGCLLLAFAADDRRSRLLGAPVLVTLGEASYALYITHQPLWVYTKIVAERGFATPNWWLVAALYVALAIAVSVLVQRVVEVPARRLFVRVLAKADPGPVSMPRKTQGAADSTVTD